MIISVLQTINNFNYFEENQYYNKKMYSDSRKNEKKMVLSIYQITVILSRTLK